MTEWKVGRVRAARRKVPFHYTTCGLDDVYLHNGYKRHRTPEGSGIAITNLDGLHRTIGLHLVARKKLMSGKEIRFLRTQMDLTQSEMARLVGCDAQSIARYEKEETRIPGPTDRLLRMIYRQHLGGEIAVREILEALDAMDARESGRQVFTSTPDGWRVAA